MKKIYNIFALVAFSLLMLCACQKDEVMELGSDAAILSCTVSTDGMSFDAGISENKISVMLPLNADLANLQVEFELSSGAHITPAPEDVTDWTGPVSFDVESADKLNSRTYEVVVDVDTDKCFDSLVRIGNNTALKKFAENEYTVLGGLFIYDDNSRDKVKNLDALNKVQEIKTDLKVNSNFVQTIEMQSLQNVGNIDIQSLSVKGVAFPELEYVSGRFRIGNDDSGFMPDPNEKMKYLKLNKLESVGKSLIVFLCSELQEINMPLLSYIGENIRIVGGAYPDLSMIKNLTEVSGDVEFTSYALSSLEGFNLKKIGSSLFLSVEGINDLESLHVLESVHYLNLVGGEHCAITSFKGLENIELNAMDIKAFPQVESTEYLPIKNGMEHIGLQMLTNVQSLDGFEKVSEVGNLILLGFLNLPDMHQLSNLTKVSTLTFEYMELIEKLPDLSKLKSVEKSLKVAKMRVLSDIKGLSSIESVGSLDLDNLLNLDSLEGLENLKKVTNGGVLIGANPLITDLAPLANLKEVNMPNQMDRIVITFNELLEDYTAVHEILTKYWNVPGSKQPKVEITNNKYNPTYQDLMDGKYTPNM